MKAKGIIVLLVFMLPIAMVETACGRQAEHGTSVIRIHEHESGRGWLGVSIEDVTRSLAKKKDLKVEEGAFVRGVEDDTPADSAGIKGGDVITEFDGKKISDASDLSRAVGKTKPGTVVNVTLMRNNEKKSLKATIGERSHEPEVRTFTVPRAPQPPRHFGGSSAYGLSLMELNRQLGEYFEAPNSRGVLVERVKRNTEAEKAGFKAGDVIVKIGKETIADVDDIWEALEDYKDGEKADVEVLRKGVHKVLTLTVDESERGPGFRFRFNDRPFGEKFMDFDVELPDKGEVEKFHREIDKMKLELEKIPKNIQEQLRGLPEKVKKAVENANLSRSV